jgi:Zn-dependent protease
MGGSIRLGSILGIPLSINYSWFIIFAIVTVSLGSFYFPDRYDWSPAVNWIIALATSLLFFCSVLAHELTHSVISERMGVPVKGINLFIFGGVSQITREASRARNELIMAGAGPASSIVLGLVFLALAFAFRDVSEPVYALSYWLSIINFSLGAFNLVPGFPLDGGRVFRSIIWGTTGDYRRATAIAARTGQGVGYLMIFGGVILIFIGLWPSGIWLALIGWFLENAASSSYRASLLRDMLAPYTASDVMTQDCAFIPPETSVRTLVDEHILRQNRRCFMVADDGHLRGIVTLYNLRNTPRSRWQATRVEEIMTPYEKLLVAAPNDSAVSVLERMDENDVNQLPVIENGQVRGMIGRDNLLRFIRTHAELQEHD